MLENIAWNSFKKTGNINFYLEFKEVENLEKNIKESINEESQGKWCNNCRK